MFEIKNVTKKFNDEFALNDISMKIDTGLNYIIGASGSGKTTLLKIMSGLDTDFEGDVFYCSKNIKELNSNERSYLYNNVFGFVWQDFNLLDDDSVLENVILPKYLKDKDCNSNAQKALAVLKIQDIANQKVKYLSGGQKQRVAIARELMKNPQVIIADEPTSALDEKTAKSIMEILREIAKNRIVIVVTHDTTFVRPENNVFELDKGVLISTHETSEDRSSCLQLKKCNLSLKNAFTIAKTNIKNKMWQYLVAVFSIIIAGILLLTTVSNGITDGGVAEFNKLLNSYGNSILDISLYNSFIDAAGTGGNDAKKPNGEVNQNIRGLYDTYSTDKRVSFIAYLQAFDNIQIKCGNKNYSIESSGNTPVINKLITGEMPMGNDFEVVVPESFAKTLGITPENLIGTEIDFNGEVVDWTSGKPVYKKTSIKAKIVGVMDTTMKYEYEGKISSFVVDDSFIFSKSALDNMLQQANLETDKISFVMRAKSPEDMISIKDELNSKGIIPLGRFELIEDIVRLNSQTVEQSGTASIVISILSIIMIVAIFLITGFIRKKEYAIYKITGFNNFHLSLINLSEIICCMLTAILVFCIASPLINIITKGLFKINILNLNMLSIGILMIFLISIIAYVVSVIMAVRVKISSALKTGDR